MAAPMRNTVYDIIAAAGSLTDEELAKALLKADHNVPSDRLNKVLLDLEILGLITVTWFAKDTRKIEKAAVERDEAEELDMQKRQREYEASFPGAEND